MRLARYATVLLALTTLSACNYVNLTESGKEVRVLKPHQIGNCELKGQTTASVKDKIGGLRRKAESINHELIIVARNAAKNLDGDSIVPAGPEADGKRTFDVYRCLPR